MISKNIVSGLLSLLALCCVVPMQVLAGEEVQEERNSLVSYLAKKDMPKAVHVDLHLRAGFYGNLPEPNSGKNEAAFRFEHVMIGLHGNITDKLSYLYRQRLNHGGGKAFELENLRHTIDYAHLNYQFNDRFMIRAGRQYLLYGSFEYDQAPIDVYEFSGIDNNITCYLTGATLFYSPRENQQFGVQIMNNRAGSLEEAFGTLPSTIEKPGAPLYYALCWNSHYMEKKWQFLYAVSAGELVKGKWGCFITGGQKLTLGDFNVYLDIQYNRSGIDYLGMIRNMGRTEEGEAYTGHAESVQYLSVVSECNYRFLPKWNIRLKGIYDYGSVYKSNGMFEEGTYLSGWGYQGSLEYYPMADNNLHIFLNALGRTYKDFNRVNMETPRDRFRLAVGFIYCLPVL